MGFFDDLKKKAASIASDFLQEDNTIPTQNIVNKPQPEQKKIFFNEQLDALLDAVLTDGEISEKERAVLCRKAESFGIDPDEFEMVLEARLFEKTKNKTPESVATPKSDKLGDVKKCPACGAIIESFSASCSECGFEFRNVGANTSVKLLSEKLEAVVVECNKMSDTSEEQQEKKEEILSRQRDIIKNFPIPNTKEDILELLYFIVPKTKSGFSSDKNYSAWRSKYSEILNRAKFVFANDNRMMAEIEKFESQNKSSGLMKTISKFNELPKRTRTLLVLGIIYFILMLITFLMALME